MSYGMTNNAMRLSIKYRVQSNFCKVAHLFSSFWLKEYQRAPKSVDQNKLKKKRQMFTLKNFWQISFDWKLSETQYRSKGNNMLYFFPRENCERQNTTLPTVFYVRHFKGPKACLSGIPQVA